MRRHEFLGLWPQSRYALRRIKQIDGEAIGFVVVLHVFEDVVVNVAEEVDLWLYPPVPPSVHQCWMFVEEAAVPATHLMIGHHGPVLYVVFLEDFGRLIEEGFVDP